MKRMKRKKTYKIYISFYNSEERRITEEQNRGVLSTIITGKFGFNENTAHRMYLPHFYNDRFYFGDPVVLTNVTEKELRSVVEMYKNGGFPKYWITYKYRTLLFDELKRSKMSLDNVEMLENKYGALFMVRNNLVTEYINGCANMKDA